MKGTSPTIGQWGPDIVFGESKDGSERKRGRREVTLKVKGTISLKRLSI